MEICNMVERLPDSSGISHTYLQYFASDVWEDHVWEKPLSDELRNRFYMVFPF